MSVTVLLIILTGFVSYRSFNDPALFNKLLHHPFTEKRENQFYRWITSGFVHGDWTHLIINLFVFWSFGEAVEGIFVAKFGATLGRINYLVLYFGSMIVADLFTYLKHKDNSAFSSVGASGAISGVVFAYVLFSPMSMLLVMFIIPMPAVLFAVLYIAYSFYASKRGLHKIFDHDAHLWGAIAGIVITILFIPESIKIFVDQVGNVL